MISAPGDNQRSLWPLLLLDYTVLVLDIDPFGLDNGQAAHGTCMPAEYMSAVASREVPYAHGTVRRATYKCIFSRSQGPYSTLVSNERPQQMTGDGRIDMYRVIVGCGNDTTAGDEKTRYDRATVGGEGEVFGLWIVNPTVPSQIS